MFGDKWSCCKYTFVHWIIVSKVFTSRCATSMSFRIISNHANVEKCSYLNQYSVGRSDVSDWNSDTWLVNCGCSMLLPRVKDCLWSEWWSKQANKIRVCSKLTYWNDFIVKYVISNDILQLCLQKISPY